jgi:hypothetical protein
VEKQAKKKHSLEKLMQKKKKKEKMSPTSQTYPVSSGCKTNNKGGKRRYKILKIALHSVRTHAHMRIPRQ